MVEILHRYTKAVLYMIESDTLRGAYLRGAYLRGADLQGADLRGADLWEADLWGADLRGADLQGAYLQGSYLRGSYLQGANLQGAYLRGANLWGADLRGSYLQGADLWGADLRGAKLGDLKIIDGGLRSDGFRFFYTDFKGEGPRIKAGCRNFAAFGEAREHWTKTRGGTPLGEETMVILEHLEKLVALRWRKETQDEPTKL